MSLSNHRTRCLRLSIYLFTRIMTQNSLVRLSEVTNHLWHLLLNRPLQHNAFNTALAHQLIQHCQRIRKNRDPLRTAVLLSGQGRSFCSGADLKERQSLTNSKQWMEQHHVFEQMFDALAQLEEPTIACVEGFALGRNVL